MLLDDFFIVLQWWSVLFLVGAAAFPLTKRLFPNWFDRGYLFSKAIGFAVVSYITYVLGTLHILAFTPLTVYLVMLLVFSVPLAITVFQRKSVKLSYSKARLLYWINIIGLEEIGFVTLLLFWSWVKAHEPSIQGLEKFMDFGFMQSILNTSYFPAADMWWAGGYINYYYFGHLVTALLTKLSGLSLGYTFNLMLATLFAITASMSFSIGVQLLLLKQRISWWVALIGGIVTAFLVTLAGNMQTIYAFTKGYTGEDVKPFWELLWSSGEFFQKLGEGMRIYWYANATRFIPFTIHEFPSYSFVVSDVHGHVLSLPFVLLALALLVALFVMQKETKKYEISWGRFGFFGFLVGILLMTNALDGPIYGGLFALCFLVFVVVPNRKQAIKNWWEYLYPVGLVALIAFATALPFLFFFSSFATGIGVNCPPAFLAGSKIGPFIFEGVEKCQHSPLWMMWLLWGFFWFSGVWLFVSKIWHGEGKNALITRILKVFFLFSIGLIIFPEFLYVKDIYPAHFRSNTMFKLGYQAFIMWSIIAGYVIIHFILEWKKMRKEKMFMIYRTIFIILLIPQLFLVSIFPIFSVRSYFGELREYKGIWGFNWIEQSYPDDWQAILWLKANGMKKGDQQAPVIVEADGESYTDYNHISAFTGYPTVTGWAVHEWLWRGTYETVSPRRDDVRRIYESTDTAEIKELLIKYKVRYIIVGTLEREKYPNIQDTVFDAVGTRVFTSPTTTIWDVLKL